MISPTFSTERARKMADLNAPTKEDIKPSEPGKKTKKTTKTPIPGPHVTQTRHQVHQGNVNVLKLMFLEKIAHNTYTNTKILEEIKAVLEKK